VGRDGAYREAIVKRRRCAHEVGRVANAEIRGNSPAHPAICLDGLVLPSWKPEFHARQVLADCDDVPEMLDALQIAGIMPAEIAVFGAIDERGDRLYPLSTGKTPEAFFHCSLHVRKRVSAHARRNNGSKPTSEFAAGSCRGDTGRPGVHSRALAFCWGCLEVRKWREPPLSILGQLLWHSDVTKGHWQTRPEHQPVTGAYGVNVW
jgi:hypothetical protein